MQIVELSDLNKLSSSSVQKLSGTLVEQVFVIWAEIFRPIFQQAKVPFRENSFWSHQKLIVICDGERVAGFLFLNLRSFQEPDQETYLAELPADCLQNLNIKVGSLHQASLLMTAEQLSVAPEYRRHRGLPSVSQLLSNCLFESFRHSSAEVLLGVTRRDRKVNELAESIGAESLGQLQRLGCPCELMLLQKANAIASIDPNVKTLWDNRLSLSLVRDWPVLENLNLLKEAA